MSRVRDLADNNIVFVDGITTADITEGSNLFFTNTRADARVDLKMIDEDNMSSNSAAHMPSQQSVKAYIDAQTLVLIDEDNMATNSATRPPSQQSVKAFVDTSVAGIVDSAPGTLDTLNELAAALGDDASFSTTVTNSIATKLPLAGGTLTGGLNVTSGNGDQLVLDNAGERFTQIGLKHSGTQQGALWLDDTDSMVDLYANIGHGIRLKTGGDVPRVTVNTTGYVDMNSASQIRLTLGSTGAAGTNTANWIRGTAGQLGLNGASDNIHFEIGGTYAMKIDSSRRLLVGKSSSNYATEGVEIRPNEVLITKAGANPLSVRNNGAGGIISFNSAGTSVGNIGIESSGFYVDGEGSHAGLKLFAGAIGPRQNGADIDATIDLGWTGGKFKDIYASGTVYATPGGNDGSSANYAAKSANEILNNYGYKPSGLYWIREPNTGTPKQIYCDMETDGGGWMLWLEYNTGANSMYNQATATANLARSYNNNYSKYEVMVDASYVNQINRRSLRGVWELDANGGIRTNGFRNWGEVRIPESVGNQFQPEIDAYFNSGADGEFIKRTEYYAINGASGWASIGSGSQRVYIREPNPAVKPGTLRSYAGINYEWAYDGTQYGWWVHESSYAVPMFNSLTKNAGYAVTYDNGRRDVFEPGKSNSDVNVNNGNNGPGVVGVGKGILVGEFSLQFNLGYSWGWSEMYIGDAVPTGLALAQGASPYANKDQFGIANNSSNNQSYYQWRTSDGVQQVNVSGLTPYSFGNYWTWNRQSNGNVYLRNPGGTVYTLGTFFGPMKFFSGAQSPHRTEVLNIQSAGRNSALTAGSGNPSTTLRH